MSYTATINKEVSYEIVTCGECDSPIALTINHYQQLRRTGEGFYCPRGHCRAYRDNDNDRLKKQLAEQTRTATQMAERAKNAELANAAAIKEMKRIKKRINAGICACCNRTFQDLARHMKTKHGDVK